MGFIQVVSFKWCHSSGRLGGFKSFFPFSQRNAPIRIMFFKWVAPPNFLDIHRRPWTLDPGFLRLFGVENEGRCENSSTGKIWMTWTKKLTGWWQLKKFRNFHPEYLGFHGPNLTVRIFFKGVEIQPPTCANISHPIAGTNLSRWFSGLPKAGYVTVVAWKVSSLAQLEKHL